MKAIACAFLFLILCCQVMCSITSFQMLTDEDGELKAVTSDESFTATAFHLTTKGETHTGVSVTISENLFNFYKDEELLLGGNLRRMLLVERSSHDHYIQNDAALIPIYLFHSEMAVIRQLKDKMIQGGIWRKGSVLYRKESIASGSLHVGPSRKNSEYALRHRSISGDLYRPYREYPTHRLADDTRPSYNRPYLGEEEFDDMTCACTIS